MPKLLVTYGSVRLNPFIWRLCTIIQYVKLSIYQTYSHLTRLIGAHVRELQESLILLCDVRSELTHFEVVLLNNIIQLEVCKLQCNLLAAAIITTYESSN